MIPRQLCLIVLSCAAGLRAQDPPAQPAGNLPAQKDTSSAEKSSGFVRRFSVGGTLNFLPVSLMSGGTSTQTLTSPAVTIDSNGSSQSNWFSGGAAVQVALTGRLAITSNLLILRPGYEIESTATQDTVTTTRTEQTRATYWEVPVLLRRFSIDRDQPGFRWFYEGGGSVRWVSNIKTQVETTSHGTTTCCDAPPAASAHRTIAGATLGAGLYLLDEFGVRIVPEIRYTRWFQRTFAAPTASSQLNQVEVMVSITF
jgi:hypothetical protein